MPCRATPCLTLALALRQLASAKRLIGMLTALHEELPDVPLFQQLNAMCGVLHVTVP